MKYFCVLQVVLAAGWIQGLAEPVNPFPREVISTQKLVEWTFREGSEGWSATHDCTVAGHQGTLEIHSTGNDPYVASPALHLEGPVSVTLRARCATAGSGQFFWMTTDAPTAQESRSEHFQLKHDGQWHDYSVSLPARGTLTGLRFDPGEGPGLVEVATIAIERQTLHPLELQSIVARGHSVELVLKNHGSDAIVCAVEGQRLTVAGNSSQTVTVVVPGSAAFERRDLEIHPQGYPSLRRAIVCVDADRPVKGLSLRSQGLALEVADDGSGARIERDGKLVGFLAPLVTPEEAGVALQVVREQNSVRLVGRGVQAKIELEGDEIVVNVRSARPCEGPVLRALGPLEQGLLAGVEYLARGEASSSTLDLETEEHIRFAPDPLKITMPLMAFVTDRATTALTWSDMTLQPVFATPNFLDGAEGHRAALRGTNIQATVLVTQPRPLEESILWAVKKRGLPPLPQPVRTTQEQLDFCLKTLTNAPLRTPAGWGHCAEPRWERHPFADQASTIWRLTGQAPELPNLVPGGSHLRNDAIYFVTGRASEWLKQRSERAQAIISEQQTDGSFRYHGKYQRGHFEDTASGYCAPKAAELLETARWLGNDAALAAGLKALKFMSHFQDPRGAQTWECPLHTPDILAAAYLVEAYLLGYELSGQHEYLERARVWALTGLPFIYQWSCRPIMAYATTPVFGATEWRAPNWIGLPVQWCGYDYAYALVKLAPLDPTLDWKRIARGILLTAEQMQYPDGLYSGCVPDSFNLAEQHRNGPAINPCALVSLRLVLEGQLDALACAIANGHRIVAPFPVSIRERQATIQARPGVEYQAVLDGTRLLKITSKGTDLIDLDN